MKNVKLIIASIGILLVLWVASWFKLFDILDSSKTETLPTSPPTQAVSEKIKLMISFEDSKVITYSKDAVEEKTTAFSILEEAAEANSLTLDTKQYDFGVFVESIDGQKSGPDKSWIYFVNGQSGSNAADKNELKPGDRVEWKYVKPEGE